MRSWTNFYWLVHMVKANAKNVFKVFFLQKFHFGESALASFLPFFYFPETCLPQKFFCRMQFYALIGNIVASQISLLELKIFQTEQFEITSNHWWKMNKLFIYRMFLTFQMRIRQLPTMGLKLIIVFLHFYLTNKGMNF